MKLDVSEVVRFKQEPWEEGDSVLVLKRLSRKRRNELTTLARQKYIEDTLVAIFKTCDRLAEEGAPLAPADRDELIRKCTDALERGRFSMDIAWLGNETLKEQLAGFENVNFDGEPLDPVDPKSIEMVRELLPDEIIDDIRDFINKLEHPRKAAEAAQKARLEAQKKTSASGSPGEPPASSPDAEKSATTSSAEV